MSSAPTFTTEQGKICCEFVGARSRKNILILEAVVFMAKHRKSASEQLGHQRALAEVYRERFALYRRLLRLVLPAAFSVAQAIIEDGEPDERAFAKADFFRDVMLAMVLDVLPRLSLSRAENLTRCPSLTLNIGITPAVNYRFTPIATRLWASGW